MTALDDLQHAFLLPLSEIAYYQFCEVAVVIQSLQLNFDKDVWSYIWGNAHYSSQNAYKHLLGTQAVHPAFGWLWKSSWQMKYKVFFWLLLQNRLNTRAILRRRNMTLESYTCEICIRQREETLSHLFLRCPFAKNCWLPIECLYQHGCTQREQQHILKEF
jgi:hypothetical protein